MKARQRSLAAVLATGVLGGASESVLAQDEAAGDRLEEVVVTAEKREVSIKDIPIAIYAASGKELVENGVGNVQDLTQLATGLQFGTQSNTTFASIRGVGSEVPDLGGEAAVAITQDGLPLAHPQLFNADFLDVQRIEVLRGPQGTIAGRNASAGAINVYSNLPTAVPQGTIKVGVGSYSQFRTDAVLSGPVLGSGLLGRIAFSKESANGWWRNTVQENGTTTRQQDTNDANRTHLRGSLLANSSEDFNALLTVEYLLDKSIPQTGVYLNARTAPGNLNPIEVYNQMFNASVPYPDVKNLRGGSNFWQSQDIRQINTTLKLTWDISPTTSLTSLTGYLHRDSEAYYDYNATIAPVSENAPIAYEFRSYTQEVTLLAKPLDAADLIAGAIYFRDYGAESPLTYVNANQGLTSPGYMTDGPYQWNTSTGVYAQFRYFPMETLHFDVGARYTWDKKDYEYVSATLNSTFIPLNLRDDHRWSAFTPRVAVGYDISQALNFYASVARGYKTGGYNTFAVPLATYNPETVTTYETGLKYQERALSGGVTVFYSQYKDIQQFLYRTLVGTSFANEIVNASAARIYGLEADIKGRVTDALSLFGNFSYTHARFTDLNTADPYTGGGIQDLSGNTLPRAPTIQAVVGAEFKAPVAANLNFLFTGNYRWQTRQYNDLFDTPAGIIDAYGILNLRAGIESRQGSWQAAAFLNNATDRRYFTNILIAAPGTVQGNVGAPRTYGVTVAYNF